MTTKHEPVKAWVSDYFWQLLAAPLVIGPISFYLAKPFADSSPIIIHTPESLEQFARECFEAGMLNCFVDKMDCGEPFLRTDKTAREFIAELKKENKL